METVRTAPSLAWFLLLAMALHLPVARLRVSDPRPIKDATPNKTGEPVVVERWRDERPIAQTERLINQSKHDRKAKHVGEFHHRTDEETQAKAQGAFQSGWEKSQDKSGFGSNEDRDGELAHGQEGEGGLDSWKAKGLGMSDLMAEARTPRKLEGIAEGSQTVINTDQVMYASFMNRITDAIYEPWKNRAIEAATTFQVDGRALYPRVYSTLLQVLLNRDGEVTSIEVLESSGVPDLDDAPKEAFWEARAFPNPPTQMQDEKGFTKFAYRFDFELTRSFFNITPSII